MGLATSPLIFSLEMRFTSESSRGGGVVGLSIASHQSASNPPSDAIARTRPAFDSASKNSESARCASEFASTPTNTRISSRSELDPFPDLFLEKSALRAIQLNTSDESASQTPFPSTTCACLSQLIDRSTRTTTSHRPSARRPVRRDSQSFVIASSWVGVPVSPIASRIPTHFSTRKCQRSKTYLRRGAVRLLTAASQGAAWPWRVAFQKNGAGAQDEAQ